MTAGPRLWVDADACPVAVKEILYRAAERLQLPLTLVANQSIHIPRSPQIRLVRVGAGFDVADRWIVDHAGPGDLVVTADIPLAADVIRGGAVALNPRGTLYTKANIDEHLAQRNLLDQLRSEGAISGGPSALGPRQVQKFANELDRFLARARNRAPKGQGGETMKLEVLEERDDAITQALIDGVREFNAAVMGHATSRPLAVVARDPQGRLVGGVSGRTIYDHFLIEVVWVAEAMRDAGLGERLMIEAETRARRRGCTGAQVDTLSFQAPGFYKKLGFRVIGTVEDFPVGHDRVFLVKDYV